MKNNSKHNNSLELIDINKLYDGLNEKMITINSNDFDEIVNNAIFKPSVKSDHDKKTINIINSNPQLEEALEPWSNGGKDIIVEVNGNLFNQQDYEIIQKLNDIIKDSGEIGEFELGNLKIKINSLKEYQSDLICVS